MLRVDGKAFIEPRGNRKVAQACVRHLMCNDRLNGTKIGLHRHEVTTACIDVHAAAGREFPGHRIAVGDVPIVGVIVVEHDEETIRTADYLVDLGPGGGPRGGELVAQGKPEDIVATPGSVTGRYLSTVLKGG